MSGDQVHKLIPVLRRIVVTHALEDLETGAGHGLCRRPPELQRIIDKAIAKDRERRYQTVSELGMHLEKVSFRPTQNLEFGFQRSAIWGGKGHEPWGNTKSSAVRKLQSI